MATAGSLLAGATLRLAQAGIADAGREAAWLLAHVLDVSAGTLRAQSALTVPPDRALAFERLAERRAAREPVQYILGTEEFMGMQFRVGPAVLIPRPDTETLVRESAARLHGPVRVADIGTGSGAIAIALASLLAEAALVAVDISAKALAVAQENAERNGLQGRVVFRQGDLLAPLGTDQFDAILSNPPYVSEDELLGLEPEVRDWEPRIALSPGPDGLVIFRRLLEGAPPFLKTGGFLGVEVGFGQAMPVAELFTQAGWRVSIFRDSAGVERAVIGYKR